LSRVPKHAVIKRVRGTCSAHEFNRMRSRHEWQCLRYSRSPINNLVYYIDFLTLISVSEKFTDFFHTSDKVVPMTVWRENTRVWKEIIYFTLWFAEISFTWTTHLFRQHNDEPFLDLHLFQYTWNVLLSHLFFLNLTCSCPYSYNLMLIAIDMTIVSTPLYSVANKSITCRQGRIYGK
jgi:hypothetical protein